MDKDIKKDMRNEWFQNNSIKMNKESIKEVLEKYNISKYHFTANGLNNDLDILIDYNLNYYKIQLDIESMSYNLLIKQMQYNVKEKHRYRLIKKFYGNNNLIYPVLTLMVKYVNINVKNKY